MDLLNCIKSPEILFVQCTLISFTSGRRQVDPKATLNLDENLKCALIKSSKVKISAFPHFFKV